MTTSSITTITKDMDGNMELRECAVVDLILSRSEARSVDGLHLFPFRATLLLAALDVHLIRSIALCKTHFWRGVA